MPVDGAGPVSHPVGSVVGTSPCITIEQEL